jgi:hypothetical protein
MQVGFQPENAKRRNSLKHTGTDEKIKKIKNGARA